MKFLRQFLVLAVALSVPSVTWADFYIKFSPDHQPIGWLEKTSGDYNTKESSALNGKPYLAPATREGYEPFDPATQLRSGPVLEASPPVIRYTISTRPKPTVISYEAFQDRFTAAEFNAATDYVYESDLTTGKPKRRALIQGLGRAMAKGNIDLSDARTAAFLDALVAGGVLTQARRDAILVP